MVAALHHLSVRWNYITRGALLQVSTPLKIVVIGASAGGVDATRAVVSQFPGDFNAAVFIILHIGAHRSDLPWLLSRAGSLPAKHPADGEVIRAGHIYVAPPDYHMLVQAGRVRLTKGPRENWARPAIDPLFRSAASSYGSRVIGVILTGGLNDGTAGMIDVSANGGTTIVQDPESAVAPDMPQSVIDHVTVDHVITVDQIGPLLTRLVSADNAPPVLTDDTEEDGITAEYTANQPVAITCPDCGGALRPSKRGTLTQFSCHIGHVYTAEIVVATQFLMMERSMETAMRSLNERAEICGQMLLKIPDTFDTHAERKQWSAAQHEAADGIQTLRELLNRPWLQPGAAQIGKRERY